MNPNPFLNTPAEKSPVRKDDRTEENFRIVQEKFSNVFLSSPDAITISDLESGRFIEVNDAATRIFGFPRDLMIGKTSLELRIWPDANVREILIDTIRTRGRVVQFEATERRGSGELFLASVSADTLDIGDVRYLIAATRDITERKRAEENLRESEEKFKTLFENAHDAIFIMDSKTFLDCNRSTLSVFGCQKEEIIGHAPAEFSPDRQPDGRLSSEKANEKIDAALSGEPQFFEWVHLRRDGTPFEAEVSLNRVMLGDAWYLQSVVRDVSSRRQSEQELKESEARYSALFTNSYSVSLLIDPDTGRIVDANEAAARYYGCTRSQLQAMGIFDLNHLPREKVVGDLQRAKGGKAKHFLSRHFRADGEKRFVEIYSGPITVQGKPLFYSIIHDITDSRQAGEALRESEERYRTLVDQIPDYVVVHRDGVMLYVNPAAAERMGYDAKALVGKPILPFIAPEYHTTIRNAIARRMAGENVPAYEMQILAKDGTSRMVLANGAAITFGGKPASLNVLSDITDRKLMEEEVRSLNRVLEQRVHARTDALVKANEQLTAEIAARSHAEQEVIRSLREKDLLLREIHHRVKNNLQIIASLLKLQSRHIGDPRVLESLNESQSRIRTMALVHERIYRSSNLGEINLRDYLNYLTRQIFQFYNIQQYQVGISVTMDEILTDIDTVTPLGLILNELISNSLKHAFPEERKGMVSIGCTAEDADTIRIMYHDNGVGLPAGLDWKNTESLGLRLVNSLVDQLNGTIENGPGEGTTFMITVRQKRGHEGIPPPT